MKGRGRGKESELNRDVKCGVVDAAAAHRVSIRPPLKYLQACNVQVMQFCVNTQLWKWANILYVCPSSCTTPHLYLVDAYLAMFRWFSSEHRRE